MELSIIITSYKNPDLLKVCIDSVKKNYTGDNFEIIVADTCTEDKTEIMMRENYPEITFLSFKENVGFQRLIREGYGESSGQYILILNGDIIVKKDAIEKMLEFLKNNSEVGLVGPQLLNFNETLQYSCFKFYSPLTILYRRTFLSRLAFAKKHLDAFLMKDYNHKSAKEVDWIMGSAMMTSKAGVEKVGLMDSRFKMYMEDTDWCRRFWENGYRVVYFPDSQMYHYHGRGSKSKNFLQSLLFNRLTWIHILSGLKYFLKYAGKPLPKHN
jgi:N-acetylglucosaminyl-diphospho-decaprenol L-rhamnosyltransferase